jgi:hypothetical protein
LEEAERELCILKDDRFLQGSDWTKVRELLTFPVPTFNDDILEAETDEEVLKRVLKVEKMCYWKQFKDGTLSSNALETLEGIVNRALHQKRATQFDDLKPCMQISARLQELQKMHLPPMLGGNMVERQIFNSLVFSFHVGIAFINAQEEVQHLLVADEAKQRPDETKSQLAAMLNQDHCLKLFTASTEQVSLHLFATPQLHH